MYNFDAYEAVDVLIDEINDSYTESGEDLYQQIYEELCERVECGELTLEEANIINDAAANKYLVDDEAFEAAVDICLESLSETDPEMFEESAKAHPYEGIMSEKAYKSLVAKAITDDSFEIPGKYAGNKAFVRAFKKDVAKAKKAARTAEKSGIDKKTAIKAAVASVLALTAGTALVVDKKSGHKYSKAAIGKLRGRKGLNKETTALVPYAYKKSGIRKACM